MKAITLTVAVLFVVLVASTPCLAEEMYGCERKNGKLRIVTDPSECKKNEVSLTWTLGPLGVSCPENFVMQGLQDDGSLICVRVFRPCRYDRNHICSNLEDCNNTYGVCTLERSGGWEFTTGSPMNSEFQRHLNIKKPNDNSFAIYTTLSGGHMLRYELFDCPWCPDDQTDHVRSDELYNCEELFDDFSASSCEETASED